MVDFSIDKTTLLAISIPMVALVFVGYISYENTIQFIQIGGFVDRINLKSPSNAREILQQDKS